jgi:hypothetical protein
MKQRCHNSKAPDYERYGGRGIAVCDEWRKDFRHFLADMGIRPEGKTLERIDNSAGYSKWNCVWATPAQQASNRRNSRYLTCAGLTLTLSQWSRKLNIGTSTIFNRLRRGWTTKQTLSPFKRKKGTRYG